MTTGRPWQPGQGPRERRSPERFGISALIRRCATRQGRESGSGRKGSMDPGKYVVAHSVLVFSQAVGAVVVVDLLEGPNVVLPEALDESAVGEQRVLAPDD